MITHQYQQVNVQNLTYLNQAQDFRGFLTMTIDRRRARRNRHNPHALAMPLRTSDDATGACRPRDPGCWPDTYLGNSEAYLKPRNMKDTA